MSEILRHDCCINSLDVMGYVDKDFFVERIEKEISEFNQKIRKFAVNVKRNVHLLFFALVYLPAETCM